jgi:tetratricopeptide (TPR) repeat protein
MIDHTGMARGQLLYQQRHYDSAASEFLKVLTDDPQNARAQAMLSLCSMHLKRWKEAIKAAREAISLDPNEVLAHHALAVIMLNANRVDEAEQAIRNALELDPEDSDLWHVLGSCQVHRQRYQPALEAAERGLQLDPGHSDCRNLRSLCLMKLGRLEAAREGLREELAENPENPDTLANMGFACLHGRKHREALEHFKEALRIDAEHEYARAGLMEGLRANYPVYGLILRFFLWLSGFSREAQQAILLGMWLGETALVHLARQYPVLRPFVRPFIIVYTMFAYLTWVAKPLTNLMLRFNRYGKLVLNKDEIDQSTLVAGCLGLSGVFFGLSFLSGPLAFLTSIFLLTLVVPLAAIHDCPEGTPRSIMTKVAGALAVIGSVGLLLLLAGNTTGFRFLSIYFQLLVPCQFLIMHLTTTEPEKGHD